MLTLEFQLDSGAYIGIHDAYVELRVLAGKIPHSYRAYPPDRLEVPLSSVIHSVFGSNAHDIPYLNPVSA